MQINRIIPAVLLFSFFGFAAHAQVDSAKGMATVSYESKVTPEIKAQAFHDAQVNAVERYFAESGASQSENFDVIRNKVSASINNYVLGATVLSEENRQDAHQ